MKKLLVSDLDVRGKRVLVRADLNVPIQDGKITDTRRIDESLPTIRWLIDHGARVILMSHFGRPKHGKDAANSLRPVADQLSQLLRKEVRLAPDSIGPAVESLLPGLGDGDVLLLENLRFHPGEEANDPAFCAALAKLGELYVNDAFGTSHRRHASMYGVAKLLPLRAAGFLLEKEIAYLGRAIENPKKPFVAIIGGAKVSGKIEVIRNLLGKVDHLLIGGGMSYTIFKAMGYEIGKSLLEADAIGLAKEILESARSYGPDRLILPSDVVAADRFADDAHTLVVPVDKIPADRDCLDIGPDTIRRYSEKIRAAKTVIWNGPMGKFEFPSFAKGTRAVAEAMVEATRRGATTIVGGGDSAAAVTLFGLESGVSHVSTGGGASLEFLEGVEFPGIEELTDKK
jgi:phosphoglycerate kinase